MIIINTGTSSQDMTWVFDEYESSYSFEINDRITNGIFDPEFIIERYILTEKSDRLLTESGQEIIY
jgi:hypothetical protein